MSLVVTSICPIEILVDRTATFEIWIKGCHPGRILRQEVTIM